MFLVRGQIRLSASDLMRFQGCRHATALDLRLAHGGDLAPAPGDESALLLQRQGDEHEARYLRRIKARALDVEEIPSNREIERAVGATMQALQSGPDVIYQGAFLSSPWGGYCDFLEKVDMPSSLGNFSYEVVDTKLKRRPDPKHLMQLSLYSDLLGKAQGVPPRAAHLELGDGTRHSINLRNVQAYVRHAQHQLVTFIANKPTTTAEPCSACSLCRWKIRCEDEWDKSDSLALVAGMTMAQRRKVSAASVGSMKELGARGERIPGMTRQTQARLSLQARLQTERRAGGAPAFVLREAVPGRGLDLLPAPDKGDIFYDIEGDPFYEGGLEYLHGLWLFEDAQWQFRAFWAHDRVAEGEQLKALLIFLRERLATFPNAHIYHYAPYEVSALRRLTAFHRHGEEAFDHMQRNHRFVDLYHVVSGALIASEPGYSIKNLEAFYMQKRTDDIATAGASVVEYERWRDTNDAEILAEIEAYNRTDCISTKLLRDWIVERVRPDGLAWSSRCPPDAESSAQAGIEDDQAARRYAVLERLGQGIGRLVADIAGYTKREDKPAWWAIFDRSNGEDEAILNDADCLAALRAIGEPLMLTSKSASRQYAFPAQVSKLRSGDRPCIRPAIRPEAVEVIELDTTSLTVTLKRSLKSGELPNRLDLLPAMPISKKIVDEAIAAACDSLVERPGHMRALEDLLARHPPRLKGTCLDQLIRREGAVPTSVSRAIATMDRTVLPIQGPPGSGKTFLSAHAIVDAVHKGHRVAVSSNSHKAIENLLIAVAQQAKACGQRVAIVQKVSGSVGHDAHWGIECVTANNDPRLHIADVVGGTVWHFAGYEEAAFGYLFVDEAGQVSLANVVGMGRAARNLVLVGDPMQLPQPVRGHHPGDSGKSCLEYSIGDARVVAPSHGIFIPESRRMHPRICKFISDAVYDGSLASHTGARHQDIISPDGMSLAGAHFVPVEHEGCAHQCPAEIDAIRNAIGELVGLKYMSHEDSERPLELGDIMVVAPYNAQVNALRNALPQAVRVGTVDRFQGQEAAVCLISMTTSSTLELPRDIEFLFSVNRLNVAISRAKVIARVYASPRLLEVPCKTIDEMKLINTLCRLAEMSTIAAG